MFLQVKEGWLDLLNFQLIYSVHPFSWNEDQIPQKSQEELVKEAFDPRSGEQGYQVRKLSPKIFCSFENLSAEWRLVNVKYLTAKF